MNKSIFIYSFLVLGLAACGKTTGMATDSSNLPAPTPATGGTAPTTPSAPPTVTDAVPLALQIYTTYDTSTAIEYQTFTETNSTVCQATAASPNVTCTVNIPEGRLFYSSLSFQFAWTTSKCRILHFQPYYYQASVTAGFAPPWATDATLDCSKIPFPSGCWSGAAPYLVPQFPKYIGLYYTLDESQATGPLNHTETLKSANTLFAGSNRLTVNDLAIGKRGISYSGGFMGSDAYLAGTFVDYLFYCRDDYDDPLPYFIHLNVRDVDSAVGNVPEDDHFTWKEAP